MIEIKQRCLPSITMTQLEHFNRVEPAYQRESLHRINLRKAFADPQPTYQPDPSNPYAYNPNPAPVNPYAYNPDPAPAYRNTPIPAPVQPPRYQPPVPPRMTFPELTNPLRKGQKTPLMLSTNQLELGFGWNVNDGRCDVDASAFLLTDNGRVPSDDWFVFYGHPQSPDGSVELATNAGSDRQQLRVDLSRLNPAITRIAFVITINEAVEQGLNFGMISEAYVRLMEHGRNQCLVSYRPDDLNAAITSMTIAELYLHNGQWKFNPVGNGVNRDLAGQCAFYGVETV